MNIEYLQDVLDRLRVTSGQRWLFVAVAVVCAVGASTMTALAAGHQTGVVLALVFGFSATACARADSNTALATTGIILWQWIGTVDDATSTWAVGTALCVFVFHTLIALMAVTPITATVVPSVLRRWLGRMVLVALATLAMWAGVVVLDQRQTSGSVVLTFAGFVALTALVFLIRANISPTDQVESQ